MIKAVTRNVTWKRINSIDAELSQCIGSFVSINGHRWYICNIFSLPGNRKHFVVGGSKYAVFFGGLQGDEYKTFSV
jgi:hypothetical protein